MTMFKSNSDRVPAVIKSLAESAKAGKMDRREFLALASVMGASTALAYSMLGLVVPKMPRQPIPRRAAC
jgi:peptide/nickel transport system substrate-binding protein